MALDGARRKHCCQLSYCWQVFKITHSLYELLHGVRGDDVMAAFFKLSAQVIPCGRLVRPAFGVNAFPGQLCSVVQDNCYRCFRPICQA